MMNFPRLPSHHSHFLTPHTVIVSCNRFPQTLLKLKYLPQSQLLGETHIRISSCHQLGTACVPHTPMGTMPWRSEISSLLLQVHTLKSGPFGPSVKKRMWPAFPYSHQTGLFPPACLLFHFHTLV